MTRLTASRRPAQAGHRPRCRSVASLLIAGLLLAACSGDGQSESTAQGNTPTAASSPTGTGTDTGTDAGTETAFPVTIEHKYGETTIESEPKRVVSVGFNEQDTLLALGVIPVAVRDWFGDKPHATWEWAQDELGDAEPTVLPVGELDMEQIATEDPDLIVGIFSGLTRVQYDQLSQFAPVVAQPDDYVDFGVPWQEQTRIIGRAVGRPDRAAELISDLESRIESVREQHPEFQGATGLIGLLGGQQSDYHLYGPQDLRGRLMTSLGFEIPDQVVDLTGEDFFTSISKERLSVTDVDVMTWIVNESDVRDALRDEPLYHNLDVATQGRDVFLDVNGQLAGAMSFSSVLSLPYLLDDFVPMLETAIDGNPKTEISGIDWLWAL